MTTIFSYPYIDLTEVSGKITISTGPVIVSKAWDKVLLHISETTHKYQFIGGRLDDNLNFRENAIARAKEVIGNNVITLSDTDPLIIKGTIERDGHDEDIILIHYLGSICDEESIENARWFSLNEVILLDAENKTSSENIKIASEHFLRK